MLRIMARTLAYLRAVKRGEAIFGPALLLLILLVAVIWVGYRSGPQVAAGQPATPKVSPGTVESTVPIAAPAAPLPELTLLTPPKAHSTPERPPAGIPGLSEMDIIGYLQYFQGTDFRCPSSNPDRGLLRRVCTSSSNEDSTVLKVTVVEKGPSTVLWVRADASDEADEKAADFFSYVVSLSLKDTDPINAETWVGENISSGGEYAAQDARLKLYGTETATTLEIIATGLPLDIVSESRKQARTR